MKDKIFGVLQRVGRSFMLPIAILPVAGLLLGIGSSFTNATTIETYGLQAILGEGTILNALLTIMSRAGNIIFDCDTGIVDVYVSNENYSVDFLKDKKKSNKYNGKYIGSLDV